MFGHKIFIILIICSLFFSTLLSKNIILRIVVRIGNIIHRIIYVLNIKMPVSYCLGTEY